MFLEINPANGLAIYDQIVRQIKFAVARGVLKPGELVPSVREMAKDLAVNPNTVARAYRELQSDEVLETVRGTGLEIAPGALKQCRKARTDLIRSRLREVLVEARQSQLEDHELRALFDAALKNTARERP
jgi:GntR family transcriptional regulator